ncbi:MAG: methyltransferase [Candidatus Heimdallarchaeota archaeon]|nr:methyltransferase [Candidatus Heimdallarchaeota archaeon]
MEGIDQAMTGHYFSEHPQSSGKTVLLRTFQLGNHLTFNSQSGVFSWRKIDNGSELLLNNLTLPSKGTVLDLGCGYGFLGIALAKAYPELFFVLTDVNVLAVKLARSNCKLNGVTKNTRVLQGNLYEPVREQKFAAIITNPPLMAGKSVLQSFITGAKQHLLPGAALQLVVPKKKGLLSIQKMLVAVFGSWELVAKGSGFRVLKAINDQ